MNPEQKERGSSPNLQSNPPISSSTPDFDPSTKTKSPTSTSPHQESDPNLIQAASKHETVDEEILQAISGQGQQPEVDHEKAQREVFDKAIRELVGPKIAAEEVFINENYLLSLRRSVNDVGLVLGRRNPKDIAAIPQTKWDDIKRFLWHTSHIKTMKPNISGPPVQLKRALELMNDPNYIFAERWRLVTSYMYSTFESRNWDEPIKADDPKNKKRGSEGEAGKKGAAKKMKSDSADKSTIRRPPANHPIFGDKGPMHHILCQRGKQLNMSIDDSYETKSAKVYGANGLKVGNWWPRLLAALRDGAHGERMAGISGDSSFGAYSIVVNGGGYADIDRDWGDSIIYSSPGSFETKAKTADNQNRGAKCLLRSFETRKPVRVLRGDTKWKCAPRCGYRYDGLYEVVEKGTGRNKEGGQYIWVKLVRLANQQQIDVNKPTARQIYLEAAVKHGY